MGKGALTKGYFKNLNTGDILKFRFNPTSISTDRPVNYSFNEACGSSYPTLQYVGGGAETLSFDLYIQGKASEVSKAIKFLEGCTPSLNPLDKFNKPPLILFTYGGYVKQCVLLGLTTERTRHNTSLEVTEVTIPINLQVVR